MSNDVGGSKPSIVEIAIPPAPPVAPYKVVVGRGAILKLREILDLSGYSKIAVLTDSLIWNHWGERIRQILPREPILISVPPGEKSKTLDVMGDICTELRRGGADRKSLLLNFGGGAIGDLGGYAAASYMRGIDFVQIPTTLLSQVDASVGGKTAVDHAGIKNLVGAFQQPRAVIADLEFLSSLPPRELASGFAEVIKHGCIQNASYFDEATRKAPNLLSSKELQSIVEGSVKIKQSVVIQDPSEKGLRKILNFGHTAGHAFESLSLESSTPLLHGEAVSLGMVAEGKLSEILGRISNAEQLKIETGLKTVGLPIRSKVTPPRHLLWERMRGDKKNSGGKIYWALLSGIGRCEFDIEAPEAAVNQALDYVTAKE